MNYSCCKSNAITLRYPGKTLFLFFWLLFFGVELAVSQTAINTADWVKLNVLSIDPHKFPQVVVSFNAKSASGLSVNGITKNEIQLLEEGKSVKVANLKSVVIKEPVYLSIVVDHSASMQEDAAKLYDKKGNPLYSIDANDNMITPAGYTSPLDNAKAAIKQFVSGFNTQKDFISITGFGSEVDASLSITQNLQAIDNTLNLMKPEGKTALYDAMMKGIQEVKDVKGIRALVVITDGQDNRSSTNWKNVMQAAAKNNTSIYIIGLGEADKTILQQLADATNGQFFYANSSTSLYSIYTSISQKVQSVYQLEYTSPNLNSTSVTRDISLYADIQNATVVESWASFTLPSVSTKTVVLTQTTINEEKKIVEPLSTLPCNDAKMNACIPKKAIDNSYVIYGNVSVAALATVAAAIYVNRKAQKMSIRKQFS
jgi:VWFA-related protein